MEEINSFCISSILIIVFLVGIDSIPNVQLCSPSLNGYECNITCSVDKSNTAINQHIAFFRNDVPVGGCEEGEVEKCNSAAGFLISKNNERSVTLHIKHLNGSHSGKWYCESGIEKSIKQNLEIEDVPARLQEPKPVTVVEGKPMVLPFTLDTKEQRDIFCHFNGETIKIGDRFEIVNLGYISLRIDPVMEIDSGLYSCNLLKGTFVIPDTYIYIVTVIPEQKSNTEGMLIAIICSLLLIAHIIIHILVEVVMREKHSKKYVHNLEEEINALRLEIQYKDGTEDESTPAIRPRPKFKTVVNRKKFLLTSQIP